MRRTSWSGAALVALTGCCFGIGPDLGDNNPNGVYVLLVSSSTVCGDAGAVSSEPTPEDVQLNGSGSSVNYMSVDGCTFDFSVSNNVGTLSNGPVDCTIPVDGGSLQLVVTSYTLDFSDAGGDPQLVVTQVGTYTQGGMTCHVTVTGSGAQ